MDTVEPSPELKSASVHRLEPETERTTPAHLMRKFFGPAQAGEYETMLVLARDSVTKAVVVGMSDDVGANHLAIFAQLLDSFTKTALGLNGPIVLPKPPKGA